jgi:hypothetical protein
MIMNMMICSGDRGSLHYLTIPKSVQVMGVTNYELWTFVISTRYTMLMARQLLHY